MVIAIEVEDMVDHRTIQRTCHNLTRSKEATLITCSHLLTMSRPAKATLIASIVLSSFTVWGVHYLQKQEHDVGAVSDHSVDFDQLSLS